jgi:N-acetylmuramoyl-L-alanine amidase
MPNTMKPTIIIDPGHGLKQNGMYSRPLLDCRGKSVKFVKNGMKPHPDDYKDGFYREDFGTLLLAKEIKEYIGNQANILLTRNDERDALQYLSEKSNNKWKKENWPKWKWIVDFTNSNNADLFTSIHTNAGGGTGISCFWESAPQGIELSNILCNTLSDATGLKIRKIAKHRYLILRNKCKGKSVLFEALFHDNIKDIQFMLDDRKREKVVNGISNGLLDFLSN